MKTKQLLHIAICSLTLAGGSYGADPKEPAKAKEPMMGGYNKVSVTDKDAVAAAEFAIKAQSKIIQEPKAHQQATLELLKIIGAEEQIVAGKNYKLTLRVKESGNQKTVEAIVWWQAWRKPNPYQLISWK